METIIITLKQPGKAQLLMKLLISMDFVSEVEYIDPFIKGKKLLQSINKLASSTDLVEMTEEEINAEIKAYRNGQ